MYKTGWFKNLGENEEKELKRIQNDKLDWKKEDVLKKLWIEKQKAKKLGDKKDIGEQDDGEKKN